MGFLSGSNSGQSAAQAIAGQLSGRIGTQPNLNGVTSQNPGANWVMRQLPNLGAKLPRMPGGAIGSQIGGSGGVCPTCGRPLGGGGGVSTQPVGGGVT